MKLETIMPGLEYGLAPLGYRHYGALAFTLMMQESKDAENTIIVRNKDGSYEVKQIYRKYKSYLNSPEFDNTTGKSYMFSGEAESHKEKTPLPLVFQPFYEFAQRIDTRYNQCSVNWYRDGSEYIEPHSDCMAKAVKNSSIMILSFGEVVGMDFIPKDPIIPSEVVYLHHGSVVVMSDELQKSHRHGIKPNQFTHGSHISITFRMMRGEEV